MNTLAKASEAADIHQFDLVIDSVAHEVSQDLQEFVKPKMVMQYIRNTGIVPGFVEKHCVKIIDAVKQRDLKFAK